MRLTIVASFLGAVVFASPINAASPGFVADGDLSVCTTANFPPMTYKNDPSDERPVGIDIELIEAIANHWNAEVSYSVAEFSGLLPTLGSGRCDIIASGIYVTDKRREVYDAVKYMKSATVIITKGDDESIAGPDDLSGRSLALEAGTYYGEERVDPLNAAFKSAGKEPVAVQEYPSQQAAYQQVLVGRVDATLTEESEGAFRVAQTGNEFRIAYTWPSEFAYGLYIRREGNDVAALKAALEHLRAEGLFDSLAAKYGMKSSVFDVDYDS